MAITDHGALYGAVAFYQAARTKGIKPIIGVETYVARRSMTDKEGKADAQPFHLILLAQDWTGYQNLCRLITDAHIDGYYYKPRIDREHLARHSAGPDRPVRLPRRRDPQGARGRGLGARPQARRRVRRHLRQGPLLPRAPGSRPARAAPAQRAAPAARPRRPGCRWSSPTTSTTSARTSPRRTTSCSASGPATTSTRRTGCGSRRHEFYVKSAAQMAALFPDQPEAIRNTPADRRDDRPRRCRSASCGSRTSRCPTATPSRAGSARSASAASSAATGRSRRSSRRASTTSSA